MPSKEPTAADAATRSLVLTYMVIERYYVTEEALANVSATEDRDDALIEMFEQHNGSVYCDRLFYHDANPQVGLEVEDYDPEA